MRQILAGCVFASLAAVSTGFFASPGARASFGPIAPTHVDVGVLDTSGKAVTGMTAADFEVFETVAAKRSKVVVTVSSERANLDGIEPVPVVHVPMFAAAPITSRELSGRRIWLLVFDTNSMSDKARRDASRAARDWMRDKMTPADLVGVAAISSRNVPAITLTNDKAGVTEALEAIAGDANGGQFDPIVTVNNDERFRGITAICEALAQSVQRKTLVFFSASRERDTLDNQVLIRHAEAACRDAHVAIDGVDMNPVDVEPVPPPQPHPAGSLVRVPPVVPKAAATLYALPKAAFGSTVHLDGVPGFFDKASDAMSSYYVLAYTSVNPPKPGGYASISVRLTDKALGYVVDQPFGAYYAPPDSAPSSNVDVEKEMQRELNSVVPLDRIPIQVAADAFRLDSRTIDPRAGGPVNVMGKITYDQWSTLDGTSFPPPPSDADDHNFYVPISVELPASVITGRAQTFDVRGIVENQFNAPMGILKDTITVPAMASGTTPSPLRYVTGTTMTVGRHAVRLVVRARETGAMGKVFAEFNVPDLHDAPIRLSSIVLSTGTRMVPKNVSKLDLQSNPLIHDGVEAQPNVTRIVTPDQTMHVYFEVYDAGGDPPSVRSSMAFYRGADRVLETASLERTVATDPKRHAMAFAFDVPASKLAPGTYICEITVADRVSGQTVTRQMDVFVRGN